MKVLPYGDAAILLNCASLREAQRWYDALQGKTDEAVLGAQSVLIRGDPVTLRHLVAATTPSEAATATEQPPLEITVCYDGADLDAVAAATALTTAEVVAAHTDRAWTVAFGGFAPGFAYLTGGDARLAVPRRSSPRTRIPAGSVGLAGPFSGIYPRESPGGWQIIGRTDSVIWDIEREPPAILTPGRSVKFIERR